jgi:hypothetical protein
MTVGMANEIRMREWRMLIGDPPSFYSCLSRKSPSMNRQGGRQIDNIVTLGGTINKAGFPKRATKPLHSIRWDSFERRR